MNEAKRTASRKRPTIRINTYTSTTGATIGNAYSDLMSLAEEMRDWASNMEGTGLENTEKYQTVSETADALDSLNEAEVPASLAELTVTYQETLPYDKRRGPSRATRRDNCVAMLQQSIEALQALRDAEGPPLSEEDLQNLEALADDLQETIDEVEGLEFPSMF